jgi:hypothetical protein
MMVNLVTFSRQRTVLAAETNRLDRTRAAGSPDATRHRRHAAGRLEPIVELLTRGDLNQLALAV